MEVFNNGTCKQTHLTYLSHHACNLLISSNLTTSRENDIGICHIAIGKKSCIQIKLEGPRGGTEQSTSRGQRAGVYETTVYAVRQFLDDVLSDSSVNSMRKIYILCIQMTCSFSTLSGISILRPNQYTDRR